MGGSESVEDGTWLEKAGTGVGGMSLKGISCLGLFLLLLPTCHNVS
jgi:hypothetical protein